MIQIEQYMIGDWVMFTDPDDGVREYHQIEAADYGQGERYYRCFDPILITRENLEANGIHPTNRFKSVWKKELEEVNYRMIIDFLDNGPSNILVAENATNFNFVSIHSSFVHSIQQALRLAGQTDLADNFVVEKGGRQ